MPSLLTHQWFAQQIITRYQSRYPFLAKHPQAVWLGSQGPDPFFFYGHAPFTTRSNKTAVNAWGSFLHNQPLQKTLFTLFQSYQTKNNSTLLSAYMVGALTHYVLDSVIHPYVFYRSGFDEHGELTGRYGFDHARLEVAIDLALIDHQHLDVLIYQPKQTLSLAAVDVDRISELYHEAYPTVLNKDTFASAVKDMQRSYQFLYHAGIFRRLLIHLISGRYGLAKGLIHRSHQAKAWSMRVLNFDHTPWHHPVSDQPSTLSVLELMEVAFNKMEKLIGIIDVAPSFENLPQTDVDYDGKPFGSIQHHQDSYYLSLHTSSKN